MWHKALGSISQWRSDRSKSYVQLNFFYKIAIQNYKFQVDK